MTRARDDVDMMAETARAQLVIARPRPRRRNSRNEKTTASSAPANGIVIDSALLA
jgi:hypothetical protein